MSNTAIRTRPVEPLTWKQAADDVHVATHDGEFAGFIEVRGGGHLAHDNHGTQLGAFATFADARAALEGDRRALRAPARALRRRHSRRARA